MNLSTDGLWGDGQKNDLGERDLDRDGDRGELNDFRDLDAERERDLENLFKRLERRGLSDEDGL